MGQVFVRASRRAKAYTRRAKGRTYSVSRLSARTTSEYIHSGKVKTKTHKAFERTLAVDQKIWKHSRRKGISAHRKGQLLALRNRIFSLRQKV